VFKVLWMPESIASLAKPSNFQDGVPFIPFLQWFYDTKSCRLKLTQLLELVQIMTFSITVSSLELVNSRAMFTADSCFFKLLLPPATGFPSFLCSWVRDSNPSPHTHIIIIFVKMSPSLDSNQASQGKSSYNTLFSDRLHWKLKEEALDRTVGRTRFGIGYGPVVRQTAEWIQIRTANWIGHISCRNCLLKHVIEGELEGEVTGRWGRRRKQLLDGLKEKRRYCKLKEEALDRTLWRTRFRRGYGPVVRQTAEWMNEWMNVTVIFL
jgi:hypothetical protein